MNTLLQPEQLIQCGITQEIANQLCPTINAIVTTHSPEASWQRISKTILNSTYPFKLHLLLFGYCYPHWQDQPDSAPAFIPQTEHIKTANITKLMAQQKQPSVKDFHTWTVDAYQQYWQMMIDTLAIVFKHPPEKISDLSQGIESPQWLVGAKLNIIDSCFIAAPEKTAMIYLDKQNQLQRMSYAELNRYSNRIANSLIQLGFTNGDAIAIDMPMTKDAIAIYLGIIKIGAVVVSIADSFSPEEIASRLRITQTKGIFTQDYIQRGEKQLPLYEKVTAANAPKVIVIPAKQTISCALRDGDVAWETFLGTNEVFTTYACDPMMPCNILFSSGTTGDPKAIPWDHTTPIKTGSDAFIHQNIQETDVLAWPTNLGWMMGPWLIFAALLNRAAIAIYHDVPRDRAFGQFIQDAKVTMLGVVPTLIATWRQSDCMRGLHWQSIKVFSSTGECSNPEDMLYLMSLADYKPIIEYCGGTEIGGSYITSTVIEKNYLSHFTTPTMGLDFVLLDENGNSTDNGEVALVPPSIGLSTTLLNVDHHKVYYANMPTLNGKVLRRHGDQVHHLPSGCYTVLGRVDDTMNLGAIKVSSAEIERVLSGIDNIIETAAIGATPPHSGPTLLVIFASTRTTLDKTSVKQQMQSLINQHLNPLFKIHDVVFVNELPKTASNKIMRRLLRKQYQENSIH